MEQPRFVIEAAEAKSMAEQSNLSLPALLPALVASAKTLARTPISNYHVGAVGLGSSGRIFFGVNLEFPGLPLHHSVHAEQFLVTNLSLNAEPLLHHVAVSSAPCGHCRQFLQELRNSHDISIRILPESESDPKLDSPSPLSFLLPHRFGPGDLLGKELPLLLEPHHNGLYLLKDKPLRGSCCNGYCDSGDGVEAIDNKLVHAALEAANGSHAPYSKCPSGLAIVDCEGKVYKGSYAESAAYNPSLGPLQAALVAYVAGGGGGYERIVAAVLVETEGAVVKQEHTARLLLELVSPKCEFRVVHCARSGSGHDGLLGGGGDDCKEKANGY